MQVIGEGANEVDPVGVAARTYYHNFYLPHCGTNGVTAVPGYARAVYPGIYPNIDMHFYGGSRGQKMAFVIRPGGNPESLRLLFEGQDSLYVDVAGFLRANLQDKWVTLPAAVAYQVGPGSTIIPLNWTASYNVVGGGQVTFTFDTYDPALPLVLLVGPPPLMGGPYSELGLCYSTYMGGGGQEHIVGSDPSPSGNYYLSGSTTSDIVDFPPATGITIYNAGLLTFGLRFSSDDVLEWKTFFGGDAGEECQNVGVAVKGGGASAETGVY